MSRVSVAANGRNSLCPPFPLQDELAIAHAADRELVLADFSEPVPRVEALRAEVLRPHPDPQRARALALQPVERGGEQLAAPAAVLVFAQQVGALELAVGGREVRGGSEERRVGTEGFGTGSSRGLA